MGERLIAQFILPAFVLPGGLTNVRVYFRCTDVPTLFRQVHMHMHVHMWCAGTNLLLY